MMDSERTMKLGEPPRDGIKTAALPVHVDPTVEGQLENKIEYLVAASNDLMLHFNIFAVVNCGKNAARFNMTHARDRKLYSRDGRGELVITFMPFTKPQLEGESEDTGRHYVVVCDEKEKTKRTVYSSVMVEKPLEKELTVGGFIAFLQARNMQDFHFNRDGMGCRWWTSIVLRELHDQGYICGPDKVGDDFCKYAHKKMRFATEMGYLPNFIK